MSRGTLEIVITMVLVPLLLTEFTECGRWLAERLVRWSARRLRDPEATARCEEEWLANLQLVPGKLTPLGHAILVSVLAVPQMREARAITIMKRRRRLGTRLVGEQGTGLVYGMAWGQSAGLVGGQGGWLAYGLGVGLLGGLVGGLVGGLGVGLIGGLVGGLVGGLAYGLTYALGVGLAFVARKAADRFRGARTD
jgi:hypothetical protein